MTSGAVPSRRAVLRGGAFGGASLMAWRSAGPSRAAAAEVTAEPSAGTWDFNRGWLFGGQYVTGAEQAGYADGAFAPVTVPHTVVPLSWASWDHTTWENVFIYRKHFSGDGLTGPGRRVFADFDGVMCNASVYVNGVAVATHQGGYLPFRAELSGHLTSGDFDQYDGANRSVIRTDAMSPEDIEEAHHQLVSRWHRKRFVTKLWRNKAHYSKECIKHPMVAMNVVSNAFKKMANIGSVDKSPA